MRITCLHTADSNMAVFETALRDLELNEVVLTHAVRADLLARAEAAKGMTPAIEAETVALLQRLSGEADAIILTCSTLGPAVSKAALSSSVPLLRVDQALADKAVEYGGPIAVLCAVETTLEPTRTLFEAAARKTAAEIHMRFVPGAWDLFKTGQKDRYEAMIAAAADQTYRDGFETVVLAQASMVGAARLCQAGTPLTSPDAGLAAAVQAASTGSEG